MTGFTNRTTQYLICSIVLLLAIPLCLHRPRERQAQPGPTTVPTWRTTLPVTQRPLRPDRSGLIAVFKHSGAVSVVQFSPDGRMLAALGDGELLLLDATTGRKVRDLYDEGESLSFAPDGRTLAVADDDLHLYRTSDWQRTVIPVSTIPRIPAAASGLSPSPQMVGTSLAERVS